MQFSFVSLAVLGLFATVRGDVHQLIVGTFGTESLYTLEFDDVALTMDLIGNYTASAASSWIALSHDKKNLYGTSFSTAPAFVSYTLGNATDILYNSTLDIGGNCTSSKAIFVTAATEPPYAVYGTLFGSNADCGSVYSVDENGALSELIQNYTYKSTSGVHGMALDSKNSFIYSADDSANTLWTHKVNSTTGELTLVGSVSGPVTGADPRHLAVHPEGQYLYVILEGANELAQYSIDQSTGIPSFENVTYPLIPSNASNADYWSDEVALSFSNNYLWATSRARSTNSTGYISAFSVASNGSIISQLFLEPTTSSGGTANSVAPSEFSDKYVALTDSATGFVEIWSLASNGSAASVVAHVDIADGGCCANAV
ncbi:Carboxy-cis,cis-muconate cyclase, partial [Lachnellula cervina]